MMLNYHELTMDEAPDSPARKKQFRIICIVMMTCIGYSVISSGSLRPVVVEEGQFPGGEFIYKLTGRDYAASMSLTKSIADDLSVRELEFGNTMYNVYLDDPLQVSGRKQRFASGVLLNDHTVTRKQDTNQERRSILLEKNEFMVEATQKEVEELPAYELWPRLQYQTQSLPPVKAAVAQYKFTNGFVSALLHSYKVFPAIRQYAKEHGAPGIVPVVVTTCDVKEYLCTHYVPLEEGESFRLGQAEYGANVESGVINWKGMQKMVNTFFSLKWIGGGSRAKGNDDVIIEKEGASKSQQQPTTDTVKVEEEKQEKQVSGDDTNIVEEKETTQEQTGESESTETAAAEEQKQHQETVVEDEVVVEEEQQPPAPTDSEAVSGEESAAEESNNNEEGNQNAAEQETQQEAAAEQQQQHEEPPTGNVARESLNEQVPEEQQTADTRDEL